MFREDFVWGVASSAYQVEGTDAADGRGACVWDMFAADGRVFEHQNADTSCDHMHHYKEDIALMINEKSRNQSISFFLKLGADSAGGNRARE